jgi:hypothetical protein
MMEKVSSKPNNLKSRFLTRASLAAIALFGASPSEAIGSDREQVKAKAEQLEERIANKKPVPISFTEDVKYRRNGHKFSTILPIEVSVDGDQRYFRVEQNGNNLDSVEVKPLPHDVKTYQGSYYYNEDLTATTINSGRSVVHMNLRNDPVVGIGYEDGSETYQIVGEEVKNYQTHK